MVRWAVRSPGPHTVTLDPDPFSSCFPHVPATRLCSAPPELQKPMFEQKTLARLLHFFKGAMFLVLEAAAATAHKAQRLVGCSPTHSQNGTTTRRGMGWMAAATNASGGNWRWERESFENKPLIYTWDEMLRVFPALSWALQYQGGCTLHLH